MNARIKRRGVSLISRQQSEFSLGSPLIRLTARELGDCADGREEGGTIRRHEEVEVPRGAITGVGYLHDRVRQDVGADEDGAFAAETPTMGIVVKIGGIPWFNAMAARVKTGSSGTGAVQRHASHAARCLEGAA